MTMPSIRSWSSSIASDQASIVRPPSRTNAFGRSAPSRSPEPAATTIAQIAMHGAQEASRVKIILPLGDCSTLVTSVSTSSPMWSRAPSTTIIVPSSR